MIVNNRGPIEPTSLMILAGCRWLEWTSEDGLHPTEIVRTVWKEMQRRYVTERQQEEKSKKK